MLESRRRRGNRDRDFGARRRRVVDRDRVARPIGVFDGDAAVCTRGVSCATARGRDGTRDSAIARSGDVAVSCCPRAWSHGVISAHRAHPALRARGDPRRGAHDGTEVLVPCHRGALHGDRQRSLAFRRVRCGRGPRSSGSKTRARDRRCSLASPAGERRRPGECRRLLRATFRRAFGLLRVGISSNRPRTVREAHAGRSDRARNRAPGDRRVRRFRLGLDGSVRKVALVTDSVDVLIHQSGIRRRGQTYHVRRRRWRTRASCAIRHGRLHARLAVDLVRTSHPYMSPAAIRAAARPPADSVTVFASLRHCSPR